MHEEIKNLLNAYLDNELSGRSLRQVEVHLSSCQACRGELEELRKISLLLRGAPDPTFTQMERFLSNLPLLLPRQQSPTRYRSGESVTWWLVPIGLVALLIFVHTIFQLSSMFSVTDITGLLGQTSDWLSSPRDTLWYGFIMTITSGNPGDGQPVLSILNSLHILGIKFMASFLWQALFSLLYLGWLAGWWLKHTNKNVIHNPRSIHT